MTVDPTRDHRVLRVMTYNVRRLRDDRGAVVALLRSAEADVVALQEPPRGATATVRLGRLAREAGLEVAVAPGPSRTTALLVRPGLVVHGAHGVRLAWQPGRTRRGLAVADVDGIRVVAVHLSLDGRERARHLDHLVELLGSSPAPVVVAGDLNERPGGPSWRVLERHLVDLTPGTGPTFPAVEPRARIDAVLASPGSGAGALVPLDPDLSRRGSDHLPVVVDVLVP